MAACTDVASPPAPVDPVQQGRRDGDQRWLDVGELLAARAGVGKGTIFLGGPGRPE